MDIYSLQNVMGMVLYSCRLSLCLIWTIEIAKWMRAHEIWVRNEIRVETSRKRRHLISLPILQHTIWTNQVCTAHNSSRYSVQNDILTIDFLRVATTTILFSFRNQFSLNILHFLPLFPCSTIDGHGLILLDLDLLWLWAREPHTDGHHVVSTIKRDRCLFAIPVDKKPLFSVQLALRCQDWGLKLKSRRSLTSHCLACVMLDRWC